MKMNMQQIYLLLAKHFGCKILFEELKITEAMKIKSLIDNKLSIDLANHPISHGMRKQIEINYHFLRDQVSKNKLLYYKIKL